MRLLVNELVAAEVVTGDVLAGTLAGAVDKMGSAKGAGSLARIALTLRSVSGRR